ncbi:MAG: rRNA pseudouridine synthase [Treponema sp.]|jgi:23S rRNA pseudouridine2605 synthase|nr:rRNA pseudouridine synthase [Treponema sp.]
MKANNAYPEGEGAILRLQVYLAHAGVASRRAAEKLILAGRVRINGREVRVLGEKAGPDDTVEVDGVPVKLETSRRYLALHKPPGYLCSSFDPEGRPLAKDLLPAEIEERLYNVGRLDFRSSGLILFTNDGDFAARLSHPRAGIEKEYLVETSSPVPEPALDQFRRGISIEGIRYHAEAIERLGCKKIRVILIEGKNREIRRVFSYFHLHAVRLHRIRIGSIMLGNLAEGVSRPLSEREMITERGNDGYRY